MGPLPKMHYGNILSRWLVYSKPEISPIDVRCKKQGSTMPPLTKGDPIHGEDSRFPAELMSDKAIRQLRLMFFQGAPIKSTGQFNHCSGQTDPLICPAVSIRKCDDNLFGRSLASCSATSSQIIWLCIERKIVGCHVVQTFSGSTKNLKGLSEADRSGDSDEGDKDVEDYRGDYSEDAV